MHMCYYYCHIVVDRIMETDGGRHDKQVGFECPRCVMETIAMSREKKKGICDE